MFEIIIVYLILSVCIGLYAAKKVNTVNDFVIAGRKLPFIFILAMVFATWFGAETILGISATFLEEGLHGLASDPFGASFCLIIFGLFFAKKLYRMNLLTLGDFFKFQYSSKVELIISICIVLSYLGWVSAQITALGLVFNVLTNGSISQSFGMILGGVSILLYTLAGGMWSIAITTFVQMIVIILGLILVTFEATTLAGGFTNVLLTANYDGKFEWLPELSFIGFVSWIGAFITMALGSIPQQDVFQRVNSSKSEKIAIWGTTIGGLVYLVFAFVPILLAYSAVIIDPNLTARLMEQDPQLVLPSIVIQQMPNWLQVVFFGSLLSVIMSTASGTLLAPSIIFSNNILKNLNSSLTDTQLLLLTRLTIFAFTVIVLLYSLSTSDSIHTMVENAYRVTLAGAFVPLFAGLFWKKSSNFGALLSIALGISTWLFLETIKTDLIVEPQIIGLLASFIGMILGSYLKPRH